MESVAVLSPSEWEGNGVGVRDRERVRGNEVRIAAFADENLLIAVCENGWVLGISLATKSMLWETRIQSASVQRGEEFITALHCMGDSRRVILGSQNGSVWILQSTEGTFQDVVFSSRCWESGFICLNRLLPPDNAFAPNSVLTISSTANQDPRPVRDEGEGERLIVVTSTLVAVLNPDTATVDNSTTLSDASLSLPIADACANSRSGHILLVPAFEPQLRCLDVSIFLDPGGRPKGKKDKRGEAESSGGLESRRSREQEKEQCRELDGRKGAQSVEDLDHLSFFATPPQTAIPDTSPLRFQFDGSATAHMDMSRRPTATSLRDWEKPGRDRNGKLVDQPVTFHTRIKSSGYGVASAHDKCKTKQQQQQQQRLQRSSSAPESNRENVGKRLRMYPLACTAPSSLTSSLSLSFPLHGLGFSEDATSLAVMTSTDTSVLVAKMPSSKEIVSSYMGHDGRITAVSFSHQASSSMILSSSVDGTARLWYAIPLAISYHI